MIDLATELSHMAEHPELYTKDQMAAKLAEAAKMISKARTLRRYPGKKKAAATAA